MNASIIIPAYKPDREILKQVIGAVKNQKFKGKYELILVDRGEGFSKQMNYGINKSKYEIVVILPQDCVPLGEVWLQNLINPLNEPEVVASVSRVQFPEKLWGQLDIFAKALMIKERGVIVSGLDGKGSAYRKRSLRQIGLFDETTYRTAGEDFDTYIKMKAIGRIAYPSATVIHLHPSRFVKRLRKDYQYANGYGALVRIHGRAMPRWYAGFFKSVPLLGAGAFIASYPLKKGSEFLLPYLLTVPLSHLFYVCGFWKGFIMGKQTI